MKSKENPADLASRGCTMDELVNNNLWWNGPKWLQKPNSTPPYEQERLDNPNEEAFQTDSSLQEWNKECHLSKDNDQEKVHISRVHPSLDLDITRYSSKQRLIRITATVLRFLGGWLVVLGFNATLTIKVISWRSVTHMCFLAFSHQY